MSEAGYPTVNPYLTVKDAAAAIAFYVNAFGAAEIQRMPHSDGKRIMHAEIEINGHPVMLADEFPDIDNCGPAVFAPTEQQPAGVGLVIHYPGPSEVDAAFTRAVEAGCSPTLVPHDTFWGARFAALRDPFGHRWMLNGANPERQAQ